MISSTVPRIRVDCTDLFPCGTMIAKQIHRDISEEDDLNQVYLRFQETDDQKRIFSEWNNCLRKTDAKEEISAVFDQFKKLWHTRKYGSRFFDIHGREFQNFAVNLTNHMEQSEWRKLSRSNSHADRRVLRSRVYAIGSRDDIGWDGKFIQNADDRKKKKLEMIEHLHSLQLFDWFAPRGEHVSELSECHHDIDIDIKIIRQGTQETVQALWQSMGNEPKLIAWVNFAASHNVCGSYSVDYGGSQEEEVATNCDGAVLLGTMGQFVDTGLKSWIRGRWVYYKMGMHIPPGGNYWSMTKFVTGPFHVDCSMIATAFADFRPYIPVFCPYSERNYFYSLIGINSVKNQEELERRCMLDIEGVLKTCLAKQVHTLVTGASGCGAFRHNPYVEAKLWRICLEKQEYRCGSLRKVVFAILDNESSNNWIAFSDEFGPSVNNFN
ncbi:unnamed protein product [Rotaria socialis]|uniref:Microbial-type PARG catalytic domain-containing protein n=1 Tax=Rotaria socialis TaxID=392032 RepID=A0A817TP69_9BILA|nr:unnamed protein product [Rotaria socialis]CAF4473218.1 unnamed protein product [Rotaria socialis]